MKKLEFYKLQASGNDFILFENKAKKITTGQLKKMARKYCRRKTDIGADGLLVIEPSKRANFKMRIFNADGSEAEMCGNGARCVGLWAKLKSQGHKAAKSQVIRFETRAGIIDTEMTAAGCVKAKTTDPFAIKLNVPLQVFGRAIHVNFVNTGVPHVVVFVEGLDNISADELGREIRFHGKFAPAGANVNFVEMVKKDTISLRTYERGVEAETFACGTGAIASAIIAGCRFNPEALSHKMKVITRGGDVLVIYFSRKDKKISDVFLEGKAQFVFQGSVGL